MQGRVAYLREGGDATTPRRQSTGSGSQPPWTPRGFAVLLIVLSLLVAAAAFGWRHYQTAERPDPKIEIGVDPPGLPIGSVPSGKLTASREVEAGAAAIE